MQGMCRIEAKHVCHKLQPTQCDIHLKNEAKLIEKEHGKSVGN
jgi:hypothetical protein